MGLGVPWLLDLSLKGLLLILTSSPSCFLASSPVTPDMFLSFLNIDFTFSVGLFQTAAQSRNPGRPL